MRLAAGWRWSRPAKELSARGGREKPIMHIREGSGGQVAGVPLTRVCGR